MNLVVKFSCLSICRGTKFGESSSTQHASRPEAVSMDFVVRPQSKVDPDGVRARAKQLVQDQRRAKVGNFFLFEKSSLPKTKGCLICLFIYYNPGSPNLDLPKY